MLPWRFWRSSSWAVPLNVPTWSVANKLMQVPTRNRALCHVKCIVLMKLYVFCLESWSLLNLICFNLFIWFDAHHFWAHVSPFNTCAFAHEMAGGWRLQTDMPFLRYLPDVPCDPKSMAGTPDATFALQFLRKFTWRELALCQCCGH